MNSINGDFEKALSQYWMNSEDSSMMRKVLLPHDRVEVRVNTKINMIEWRVCRTINGEQNLDLPSFVVLSDDSESMESEHSKYVELGDLPYQEWLKTVYKSGGKKSASGELFSGKASIQEEEEWARAVTEKENAEIEREARFQADSAEKEGGSLSFSGSEEDDENINDKSLQYYQDLNKQLMSDKADAQEKAKEKIRELKKNELKATREAMVLSLKVKKFEELLSKKEKAYQRQRQEITELRVEVNKVLADKGRAPKHVPAAPVSAPAAPSGNDIAFRDKALQMFEQLKKVKDENKNLQAKVTELKAAALYTPQPVVEVKVAEADTSAVEELNKKIEKMTRSLEDERAKVRGLSEKLFAAEKGALSSNKVTDLEGKMEQAHKMNAQQKKEIEQLKQKLVQSDAEQNKIKNELSKANSQIQTLTKRQAG